MLSNILKIIHLIQNLKMEKRHSWLTNGDQESVAEHCFRLALMALIIAPHLEKPIDLEKSLKMALIHDLVEAKVGDTPSFTLDNLKSIESKFEKEEKAIDEIAKEINQPEFAMLWREFEEGKTLEAKFIRALDKMEVRIQHNESSIDSWLDIEKKLAYLGIQSYCKHDKALLELAGMVRKESIIKMQEEKVSISGLEDWLQNKLKKYNTRLEDLTEEQTLNE